MRQEDKTLLLRDLSARLPYGVMIEGLEHPEVMTIKHLAIISVMSAEPYKPYLRPMSSMTEEEKEIYHNLCYEEEREEYEFGEWTTRVYYHDTITSIDWLNAHHFDYRWLIEKGLALEAPKGMYK